VTLRTVRLNLSPEKNAFPDWNQEHCPVQSGAVVETFSRSFPPSREICDKAANFDGISLFLFPAASAIAQGGPPLLHQRSRHSRPSELGDQSRLHAFYYSDQSVSILPMSTLIRHWRSHPSSLMKMPGYGSRILLPDRGTPRSIHPGVKWRFYDAGGSGLNISSFFPQLFLNNPDRCVRRESRPPPILPPAIRILQKDCPIDVDTRSTIVCQRTERLAHRPCSWPRFHSQTRSELSFLFPGNFPSFPGHNPRSMSAVATNS